MVNESSFRSPSILVLALSLFVSGCGVGAKNSVFFGKTDPPSDNTFRYVSGSEPESIDPQIGTTQNETRIAMALFEGLAEYDPKTGEPVPALAERWEVNKDYSEITFHLRANGRFSNGEPITARDFVYTIRRGLTPATASRNAGMASYIKYAEAFNSGAVFVRDPATNSFLLERDFAPSGPRKAPADPKAEVEAPAPAVPLSSQPVESVVAEYPANPEDKTPDADTAFHRTMHLPLRVVLPKDEKKRNKVLDVNPKLKEAVAGKQFEPVKAEDIGVEAVDDHVLRISLQQSAPFFIGLIPHQFFRVLNQKAIEKFPRTWTEPENIVTSGAFKLEARRPYDRIVMVRDPMYWDVANVRLERMVFYILVDSITIMNLYEAGELDAMYNHTVPGAWREAIASKKDFMDTPEATIDYYAFNTTKGPTSDVRVRKALNMSLNKQSLAEWRKVKPLTAITPEGIFPGYVQPKGDQFDPEKAKHLLAEAGYRDGAGNFDPAKFPASEVELTINPDGSNIVVSEFIQAQWKQNLGVTIPIKLMETKTFFAAQERLEYKGIARTGWAADYMDPFAFLGLYYTLGRNNATGWWDPKYVELLDEANRTIDHQKRYDLLAQAEALVLAAQPVIPLLTPATRWMKKPYVKGMYPNPLTLHPWKSVYIERDPAKWDYGVPDMRK